MPSKVFVGTCHQGVSHFNDVHLGAEGGVHGRHFQADDAAADDEEALRHVLQGKGTGGVDDAVIFWHEGQFDAARASGDDALFEGDGLRCAFVIGDGNFVAASKFGGAVHDVDFAHFCHASEAAGEFVDDALFVFAQAVDVNFRCFEGDAAAGDAMRFFDDFADVQQRFGRDAADVEADAAQGLVALDKGDFHAEVGGAEGGGVTGRAGTDDEHVHGAFGTAGGSCRGCGGRRSGGFLGSRGCGSSRGGSTADVEGADGVAGGDFVAHFDGQGGNDTVCRGRHIHGGFVGFEGDKRVFFFHAVPGFDQDFDDVNVGEVPKVGDDDGLGCHDVLPHC